MNVYSKEILGHARTPSGDGKMPEPCHKRRQSNPICGDRVEWQIQIDEASLVEMRHQTKGCALCRASASLLHQDLNGRTVGEIIEMIDGFTTGIHRILSGDDEAGEHHGARKFDGLSSAPARRECVLLPWDTLRKVLEDNH